MTAACLHVAEASLERSFTGQVTGLLWLQIGATAYPDDNWSDFVVIVLGWWLQQVNSLLGGARTIVLRFMEGPYAVELTEIGYESASVRLRDSSGSARPFDAALDSYDLARQILAAASAIHHACQVRGWHSDDLATLEEEIRTVRRKLDSPRSL